MDTYTRDFPNSINLKDRKLCFLYFTDLYCRCDLVSLQKLWFLSRRIVGPVMLTCIIFSSGFHWVCARLLRTLW